MARASLCPRATRWKATGALRARCGPRATTYTRPPSALSLTWFSYAEDKLYQGTFLLPQEKIYHLLKQGSWDIEKQQQVPYNELTVCVLPKGVVVVWLTGGNQVLLGRYQAPEKFLGHEELVRYYGEGVDRTAMVHETWDEMPAEVQAEIKAGTLSTRRWDQWLQTYPWQVAFAQPFALYEYSANFVNAERVNDPLTRDGLDAYRAVVLTPTPKPLPRALRFLGQAPHKARFLVRVRHFDEAELRAAVERLLREHPGAPLTFYFALDKPYQKATLSLKNQWKEIPLPGSPVEVFNQQ
jgi:hypothetical protein